MASVSHYNGIKQQNRSKNDAINLPFKAEAVNKEKEICHYYVASDKASFVSVKPHTHLRQSLGHCTRNNDTFNRWIKKLSRQERFIGLCPIRSSVINYHICICAFLYVPPPHNSHRVLAVWAQLGQMGGEESRAAALGIADSKLR